MNNSEKRLPTILIVEDVDWIRAGMKREVERQGYYTLEARDDTEALAVAELETIALILTEEEVPTFDALIDSCRANSALSQTPVAIINADAEDGARYEQAYLLPDYGAIASFLNHRRN